jgi:hypothetical protein
MSEQLADDNAVDPLGHGSTVWIQELDGAKPPWGGSSRTAPATASATVWPDGPVPPSWSAGDPSRPEEAREAR